MLNYAGQILKSYELKELIDTGGFGAIYRANQTVVEREVAIKIIFPDFASRPNFIRRFEAEAQMVAGLEHPYIVPLYDYWRDPNGAYIVMRWLRGGHLRRVMRGAPMPVSDVGRIMEQIATALIFAHRYGVVHRDLKPENILLDEAGNAYLADFGIAQIMSSTRGDDEMASMGSPAYAAPEQIAGEQTTPLTDQYSLAVILYEMLTGRHPFPDLAEMTLTELTAKRISEPLPPLSLLRPDLPPAVGQVIQRASALKPTDRYEDIATMLATLQIAIEPLLASSRASQANAVISRTQQIAALTLDLPNPYKGLRTFQEADAVNFFGRRTLIDRLADRMRESGQYNRFLAVVGPSGSGKSSVVKAGLIPALRKGALPHSRSWYYVEIVPGVQPFKELEAALTSIAVQPPRDLDERLMRNPREMLSIVNQILQGDQTTELFLLIDQFEELFTQVSEAVRDRFLESLYTAVSTPGSRVRVVVTLRADFYDRPLLLPTISEIMRLRTEVITPLSTDELYEAIIEPARRLGVTLESGLETAIAQEVDDHPGALPLLQYLMSELFQRRQGMMMTIDAYRAMGGVRGALAKRAEEIYEGFSPEQRIAMQQLYLRLITLGEGTEDTRRRPLLAEVTALTGNVTVMREVIDVLGKARLLTFDRDPESRAPTIEVTHEAIIREWNRLRAWLDASRNDVRLQRNLAALTAEWLAAGRDPSYLLRDARLRQFEMWAQESTVELTTDERAFIDTSLQEQAKRQTIEQRRAENERKLEQSARNRLRILVAVMAVALLAGIALAGYALNESRRAQVESEISQSLAQAANAERALAEGDADLAIVLALEANRGENTAPQALRTLTEVVFSPGTRAIIQAHSSFVTAVDIDAQGRYVVSASRDGLVRLWSLADGSRVRELAGHRGDVQAAVFSPDGRQIASGALDFRTILWDVETGAILHTLEGHSAAVRTVAFSPDGRTLVTGGRDSDILVWDAESGVLLQRMSQHTATVQALAFSPSGEVLASGSGNGEIIFWDTRTWTPLRQLAGSTNGVNDLDFFSDGARIVSALADGTLAVWQVATGTLDRSIAVNALPLSLELVPSDVVAFVGLNNGTMLLVDVSTGQTRDLLRGHIGEVYGVALSADGRIGATGAVDATVRLWNVTNPAEQARYTDHRGRITGLALTGTSGRIISASVDQTLHIRDGFDQPARVFAIGAPIRSMSMTTDENDVLLGLADGTVRRMRVSDGETVSEFRPHDSAVLALSVSGDRAVSSSQGGGLRVWDVTSGTIENTIDGYSGAILDVALSRTGALIAFGIDDNSVVVWDRETNRERRRMQGAQTPAASVAISPNGARVAAGTRDGTVFVWDAATGALVYQLSGHTRDVWSLAFSPDGTSLISAGGDGVILWWDMTTGEAIERFSAAVAPVLKVAVDPAQQYIVSGADRGVVQVWRLYSGDRLIEWARANRYVRDLTCQERALYRVQPLCEG